MTDKGNDPFGYGQVRTGASDSPEDILFAGGGASAKADPRDTAWDPPSNTATELGKIDFGAEVLGERGAPVKARANSGVSRLMGAPAPAAPAKASTPAKTAAPAAAMAAPIGAAIGAAATQRAPSGIAKVAQPVQKPVPIRPIELPARKGAMAVPVLVVAAGGGVAAWLYYVRLNPVLAAIAGALSLALAGVALIGLKR
jgi:hypothetical protein